MREAKEAAVRRNRRIIAGVDQVYDEQFIDKWRRDRLAQKKTQRLKLSWDDGVKAGEQSENSNGGGNVGNEEDGK